MTVEELEAKSREYRRDILTFIRDAGAGHTGGSLSCTDIINVLYNHVMNLSPENWESLDRDFYVQSKGHSVEALYVVLADQGFFDRSELKTARELGTKFIGHPTRKVTGVEQNTGGLGHGLSVSVGLALAAKMDKRPSRVFCLLGDGELAEGSNWEAAMSAAHYHLDNLTAIVDRNGLQITGTTEEVNELEPLDEKWRAFGWSVQQTDGNSVEELARTLDSVPFSVGQPSVLIANTIKGKGVSFMESQVNWHHHVPTEEEYMRALEELGARR